MMSSKLADKILKNQASIYVTEGNYSGFEGLSCKFSNFFKLMFQASELSRHLPCPSSKSHPIG